MMGNSGNRRGIVFAVLLGLSLVVWLPQGALAQTADEPTLADIRTDLGLLYAEIQRLRRELSDTGASGVSVQDTGPALQRLDAVEAELRDTIGRVERLQFDVQRIVEDGTNRVGDLEFRLTELEGGDISVLGKTPLLGGGLTGVTDPVDSVVANPDATQFAVSEQSDFDAALKAHEAGEYNRAAQLFATFVEVYPGGPMSSEAQFWRGEALAATGAWNQAARSYLDAFSGAPQGPIAPRALFRLGFSLAELGQMDEACLTFSEVQVRYPETEGDLLAQSTEQLVRLGCL